MITRDPDRRSGQFDWSHKSVALEEITVVLSFGFIFYSGDKDGLDKKEKDKKKGEQYVFRCN